ncbi:mitochondrial 54S ribosomal protein mL59 [Calcarisporiella thermophila]|uniref:mitochondrial 54S ribosomal protein mL59 n=1 Tax=Calcarisporiella thermophila TaxID=911321 RepID=UPI003743C452
MRARAVSQRILASVTKKQWDPSSFQPQFYVSEVTGIGRWRPPLLSLRRQADLRKACIIRDIDPTTIGLPAVKEKGVLRSKPPKGTKAERTADERKAKIAKNLEEMPKKIQSWKEDLLREKEKNKPRLPF